MTWSGEAVIINNVNQGPNGVRCCLPAATIDRTTGRMYAWEGIGPAGTDPVELSSSVDGLTWYSPVRVSQGDVAGVQQVNVAVAAARGRVYVFSYGTRTRISDHPGLVQQQLSYSNDHGNTFAGPIALGPVSALQYSAVAGGHFPGDYIGAAISADRLYLVWCVSWKPPKPAAHFHQTLWAGLLRI